jgi:hypothetical protein
MSPKRLGEPHRLQMLPNGPSFVRGSDLSVAESDDEPVHVHLGDNPRWRRSPLLSSGPSGHVNRLQ